MRDIGQLSDLAVQTHETPPAESPRERLKT